MCGGLFCLLFFGGDSHLRSAGSFDVDVLGLSWTRVTFGMFVFFAFGSGPQVYMYICVPSGCYTFS